jgi:hypothetical protein
MHMHMLTFACLMNSAVVPLLIVLLMARDLLRQRENTPALGTTQLGTIQLGVSAVSSRGTLTDSLSDSATLGGAAARARRPHTSADRSADRSKYAEYTHTHTNVPATKNAGASFAASAPALFVGAAAGRPRRPSSLNDKEVLEAATANMSSDMSMLPRTHHPTHPQPRTTITMHEAVSAAISRGRTLQYSTFSLWKQRIPWTGHFHERSSEPGCCDVPGAKKWRQVLVATG